MFFVHRACWWFYKQGENKTTVDFVDTQNMPEGVTNTTNLARKKKTMQPNWQTSIILTCATELAPVN